MALDASQILGSPQVAGYKVNPRGTNKAVMSRSGGGAGLAGAVGGVVAGAIASKHVAGERA
jgi:hypothetical protein